MLLLFDLIIKFLFPFGLGLDECGIIYPQPLKFVAYHRLFPFLHIGIPLHGGLISFLIGGTYFYFSGRLAPSRLLGLYRHIQIVILVLGLQIRYIKLVPSDWSLGLRLGNRRLEARF
jgi:hypothetical protein